MSNHLDVVEYENATKPKLAPKILVESNQWVDSHSSEIELKFET
jgi:hypothetical protein